MDLTTVLDGTFATFARGLPFYLTKDAVAKLLWLTEKWTSDGAAAGSTKLAALRQKVRGANVIHEFRKHGRMRSAVFYYPDASFRIEKDGEPLLLDTQLALMRLLESHPQTIMAVQPMALDAMERMERERALTNFVLQIVRPVLEWPRRPGRTARTTQ